MQALLFIVFLQGHIQVTALSGTTAGSLTQRIDTRGDNATSLLQLGARVLAPKSRLRRPQLSTGHTYLAPRYAPGIPSHETPLRLNIFYINLDNSTERRDCMEKQLRTLKSTALQEGFDIHVERFPAVRLEGCSDADACVQKYPECFPSGKTGFFPATHSGERGHEEHDEKVLRGVLGNLCSHTKLFRNLRGLIDKYDIFMVLEDDAILKNTFFSELSRFFRVHPPYWTLVAIDTFATPSSLPPETDFISDQVYSISAARNMYWGAHAWLLNPVQLDSFMAWYEAMPVMAVDWVPVIDHPLHMGMWSFQPGAVKQRGRLEPNEEDWLIPECTAENIIYSDIEGPTFVGKASHGPSDEQRMTPQLTAQAMHGQLGQFLALSKAEAYRRDSAVGAWTDAELGAERAEHSAAVKLAASLATPLANMTALVDQALEPLLRLREALNRSVEEKDKVEETKKKKIAFFGMVGSSLPGVISAIASKLVGGLPECRLSGKLAGHCAQMWTLTHPTRIVEHKTEFGMHLSNTVAVAVVRHPFSLLSKLKGSPFFLDCPRNTSLSSILEPCDWKEPSLTVWQRHGSSPPVIPHAACPRSARYGSPCWHSAVDAWRSYTRGYLQLRDTGLFDDVLVVRYEDVVQHPTIVAQAIAKAAGRQISHDKDAASQTTLLENADGELDDGLGGNNTVTLKQMRQTLRLAGYGSDFTCDAIEAVCASLDRPLLFSLGYHGCQPGWPGYESLVHGYNITHKNMDAVIMKLAAKPPVLPCLFGDFPAD